MHTSPVWQKDSVSTDSKSSQEVTDTSSKETSTAKTTPDPPKDPPHPMDVFFEPKDNWDKIDIVVGRPWQKEDLRIKSNSDLHKLW